MTISDWTEEQAIDLLTQGYSPEHVAKTTGFKEKWLEKQSVPRTPLRRRLTELVGTKRRPQRR